MKQTIKVTRDELIEMIEDAQHISTAQWKFGTRDTYVIERDSKKWRFSVEAHFDDGIQCYGSVDLEEVRPEERRVIEWVPVPADTSRSDPKEGL